MTQRVPKEQLVQQHTVHFVLNCMCTECTIKSGLSFWQQFHFSIPPNAFERECAVSYKIQCMIYTLQGTVQGTVHGTVQYRVQYRVQYNTGYSTWYSTWYSTIQGTVHGTVQNRVQYRVQYNTGYSTWYSTIQGK